MALTVPGEDPEHNRLVTKMDVVTGSTMNVDDGGTLEIMFLELDSRSLLEAHELDHHSFGLTPDQAAWLAVKLIDTLADIGYRPGS